MRIGMLDVDGHHFPNLAQMKISAWHKAQGDVVERYEALSITEYDRVYMSKVFTFTADYPYFVRSNDVVMGGTGYFYPDGGEDLPEEVEHMYPDYDLYGVEDTAYGFLTRGCPRGCKFCIVKDKEGQRSRKVADLKEFWNGQKNIKLMDPNMFACPDWGGLAEQLIDSGALVDFTQGCDIRIMTDDMADALKAMKIKRVHFAWDRYQDKEMIIPKFEMFKRKTGWYRQKMDVYVLVNFDTTFEQDLDRVYTLRELGYDPYIMIYNKQSCERKYRDLQRWVNSRPIWGSVKTFEEYKKGEK